MQKREVAIAAANSPSDRKVIKTASAAGAAAADGDDSASSAASLSRCRPTRQRRRRRRRRQRRQIASRARAGSSSNNNSNSNSSKSRTSGAASRLRFAMARAGFAEGASLARFGLVLMLLLTVMGKNKHAVVYVSAQAPEDGGSGAPEGETPAPTIAGPTAEAGVPTSPAEPTVPTSSPVETSPPVTDSPTAKPTGPTLKPTTAPPTAPPTSRPTVKPTFSPRPTSSSNPSTSPTHPPSASPVPSLAPTTLSPTLSPTTAREKHRVPYARMTIVGLGALPSPEAFDYWQDTTSQHIVNWWAGEPTITDSDGNPIVLDWKVVVTRVVTMNTTQEFFTVQPVEPPDDDLIGGGGTRRQRQRGLASGHQRPGGGRWNGRRNSSGGQQRPRLPPRLGRGGGHLNDGKNSSWTRVWGAGRGSGSVNSTRKGRGKRASAKTRGNRTGQSFADSPLPLLLHSWRGRIRRNLQVVDPEEFANQLTYSQTIYYYFPDDVKNDTEVTSRVNPDVFATLPFETESSRTDYLNMLKENDPTPNGAFQNVEGSTRVQVSDDPFTEMPTMAPTAAELPPGEPQGGLSGGAIAGIIVAVLCVVAVFGIWYVYRPVEGIDDLEDMDDDDDHTDPQEQVSPAKKSGGSSTGSSIAKKKFGSNHSLAGGGLGNESVSNMSMMPFSTLLKKGSKQSGGGLDGGDGGAANHTGVEGVGEEGMLESPGGGGALVPVNVEGSAVVGADGSVRMVNAAVDDADSAATRSTGAFGPHMLMVQDIEDM